ncbi:SHOCT domain-containing protein [Halogeometricum limi]|uniref:Uncharacterized membrane protein n=1 Tax=Halogeometricum limi TaxID=555875 RepID=A0A1I6H6F0_9EURY|nr:SHOCT domain-containing protein [Halogeometricum limi]SFR49954.1 Uncharacterized membrane protein [Halogeometricum limi]
MPFTDDGFDFERFVRDHPWAFSFVVAALLGLFALVNGGSAVGSFVSFFLVTALLTLAYGRFTDDTESSRGHRSERGEQTRVETEDDQALARLRERYAEGRIDEEEFERRVETLLRTEDEETTRETYLEERAS